MFAEVCGAEVVGLQLILECALHHAAFSTDGVVSLAGNRHHRGVRGRVLCEDLGGWLLLPIPGLEGKVKICPQAFLRHR